LLEELAEQRGLGEFLRGGGYGFGSFGESF
jgi:hypothetical protein